MSLNDRIYSPFPFFWLPFLCTHVGVHMSRHVCKSQGQLFSGPFSPSFQPALRWSLMHPPANATFCRLPGPQALGRFSCLHLPSCQRNAVIITHVTISHFFCVGTGDQADCQAYAENNIFPYWAPLCAPTGICSKKSLAGLFCHRTNITEYMYINLCGITYTH